MRNHDNTGPKVIKWCNGSRTSSLDADQTAVYKIIFRNLENNFHRLRCCSSSISLSLSISLSQVLFSLFLRLPLSISLLLFLLFKRFPLEPIIMSCFNLKIKYLKLGISLFFLFWSQFHWCWFLVSFLQLKFMGNDAWSIFLDYAIDQLLFCLAGIIPHNLWGCRFWDLCN